MHEGSFNPEWSSVVTGDRVCKMYFKIQSRTIYDGVMYVNLEEEWERQKLAKEIVVRVQTSRKLEL